MLHSRIPNLLNGSIGKTFGQIRHLQRPAVNTSQLTVGRRSGAMAMKVCHNIYIYSISYYAFQVGMLAIYDKWGIRYPVTVLQLDECQVVQV